MRIKRTACLYPGAAVVCIARLGVHMLVAADMQSCGEFAAVARFQRERVRNPGPSLERDNHCQQKDNDSTHGHDLN